ncbi:MAG: hypothetical protein ACPGLV_15170, partial [Bacteroidia bacterium]
KNKTQSKSELNILVSIGLSGSNVARLTELIDHLRRSENIKLFLTPTLYNDYKNEDVVQFEFSRSEFAILDYIVGRAGLGTITECIKYRIPFLAINDETNSELCWNAHRINELEIGRHLQNGVKDLSINELFNNRDKYLEKIQKRPLNGELKVLDFLNTHM